jgi:hypothetical protein
MFDLLLGIVILYELYNAVKGFRTLLGYRRQMRAIKVSGQSTTSTTNYIGDRAIYAPDPVLKAVDELKRLNFQRVGEFEIKNYMGQEDRIWILVDGLQTTHATISTQSFGLYISLNTVFEDDAWAQTLSEHPPTAFLSKIDSPNLRRQTAPSTDPTTLIKAHQSLIAAMTASHGEARKIETPQDYLDRSALWRMRHSPTENERILRVWRPLYHAAWLSLIMLLVLIMFTAGSLFDLYYQLDTWVFYAILAGIVLIQGLPYLYSRVMLRRRLR